MSYTFLQQYWWFVVSLLGALLVFLLFVQGANSLVYSLGRTEEGLEGDRIHRSQVGDNLHHTRNLRRSLLRLVPIVLQHQLWRSLLAVDDNTLLVCASGGEL